MGTPSECLARCCEAVERDGYAILPGLLDPEQVALLIEATSQLAESAHEGVLQREAEVHGIRDLLARAPEVQRVANSPQVMDLVRAIISPEAFVVRGLYFDKTPTANWNLPWHQDVTIAVKERRDVPGFGPWTLKAKIPHAHAPAELLERMITVRLQLDPCVPENGPMRVLPGSHAHGRMSASQLHSWTARARELAVDCLAPAGGAVIMRPLIVHASAAATGPGHRRVIHLEYAAEELPSGLEWRRRS